MLDKDKKMVSDLPFGAGQNTFVVLQPSNTIGMTVKDLRVSETAMLIATNLIRSVSMVHAGDVQCYTYSDYPDIGEATGYWKCGGQIKIAPIPCEQGPGWLKTEATSGLYLWCTDCMMQLWYKSDRRSLGRTLLKLAFKQMVTGLPIGNYVNCSRPVRERHYITAESRETIPTLGVLALAADQVYGTTMTRNPKLPGPPGDHCGLGFTIVPGAGSVESFNGMDLWVAALLLAQFNEDQQMLQQLKSDAMGPLPKRS